MSKPKVVKGAWAVRFLHGAIKPDNYGVMLYRSAFDTSLWFFDKVMYGGGTVQQDSIVTDSTAKIICEISG